MPRLFLAWVALTLAIGVAPAHAITPTDAVSRINALRVQNSLPPLVEDALLSRECRAHARYMALNDGWDEEQAHGETPGRPGYSEAGARAARQSVLAGPAGWTNPHPWVESAEHVRLIMDPELQRTGYGEQDGWACLQVIKGPRPDLAGQVFTFPGPGGVLPEDASALIVYTPNADVTFTDERLTGPEGEVAITSAAPFLELDAPLARGTTYLAEVELNYPPADCSRVGAPPVHPPCPDHFAPWCYPSLADYLPDWLPAEAAPYDPVLCKAGQRPPVSPDATVKAQVVPHAWQFTTPGAVAARCAAALAAPARMKQGLTMRVYVRMCAATSVTAEIFRGSRRLSSRKSRLARFRLSTRSLTPGRYRLQVIVGGTRISQSFTVRV